MDDQLIELIRDRFDSVDAKLNQQQASFELHAQNDEKYWKLIDEQQAQLSLIKWISSGLSGSALLAWLYTKFGGH